MIYEYLAEGEENARTGKYLAQVLACDGRSVMKQVERERRDGQPICASTDPARPGYYLAADADELRRYCNRLYHRGCEMLKTRKALLNTLKLLQDEK